MESKLNLWNWWNQFISCHELWLNLAKDLKLSTSRRQPNFLHYLYNFFFLFRNMRSTIIQVEGKSTLHGEDILNPDGLFLYYIYIFIILFLLRIIKIKLEEE